MKGNRTSRTSKITGDVETYSYDSQNRLVGYVSPATTASYAYDAMERRIAKTVNGAQTAYAYDISTKIPLLHDDIVLEFDGSSSVTLKRRWAHSSFVDDPLGFEEYTTTSSVGNGLERAVLADRQGSVIWVTEPATGTIAAAYDYEGYGTQTQTQGTLVQRYGYTGREFDPESSLYYYRARSYDPNSGVFLQMDPIGFQSGTFNLYAYVNGNPFGYVDPDGLTATTSNTILTAGSITAGLSATAHVGVGILGLVGRINRALFLASNITAMAGIGHNSGAGEGDEPSEEEKELCVEAYEAAYDAAGFKFGICMQIAATEPRASSRKKLEDQCKRQYGLELEWAAEDLAACLKGQ